MSRNGLVSLAALLVLSLFLMGTSGVGLDSWPRRLGFSINHSANSMFFAVLSPFNSAISFVRGGNEQASEVEDLKAENARLQAEISQLREIAARYEELQQLSKVRADRPNDEYVEARVMARDASGLNSAIAIDQGTSAGIREGMVALAPNGTLVGKVIRAAPGYAWIRLLNDPNLAVTALVQPSRSSGTISGNFGPTLALNLVPQGDEINVGDTVLSAGLGSGFPPSIPIGKVKTVSGERQEVFKQIEVEPLSELSALDHVLVITNFAPEGFGRP
jgi:rod shape-determining protein MreC